MSTTLKTTLFKAINAATLVVAKGYEIDFFKYDDNTKTVEMECCDDSIATLADQDIEIDADGSVLLNDTSDEEPIQVRMEFKVLVPLDESHLN